jgi:hypothetical protein
MKQIVNTYSVVRRFETKDNGAENIKNEIGKYIDEMCNCLLKDPNNENFQISELTIKRFDEKVELSKNIIAIDDFCYTPSLKSYKKPEKKYRIKITANVIRNTSD